MTIQRTGCIERDDEGYYVRKCADGQSDGGVFVAQSPPSITDSIFWPDSDEPMTLGELREWKEEKQKNGTTFDPELDIGEEVFHLYVWQQGKGTGSWVMNHLCKCLDAAQSSCYGTPQPIKFIGQRPLLLSDDAARHNQQLDTADLIRWHESVGGFQSVERDDGKTRIFRPPNAPIVEREKPIEVETPPPKRNPPMPTRHDVYSRVPASTAPRFFGGRRVV